MARLDLTDPIKLGERLRVARKAASITQERAAQEIDAVRTTIIAIEKGQRQIQPAELISLAELYNVSVNTLFRNSSIHTDIVAQFRRSYDSTTSDDTLQEAASLLRRLATSCAELEQILGKRSNFRYPAERQIERGDVEQQAEDMALEVRSSLGIGLSPILDVLELFELEIGIRIFPRPLDSNISGLFTYHPEVGACILVNSKHRFTRQAWTLAHELGHFITARNSTEICLVWERAKPVAERFADLFAAAFLMPGATVRKMFNDYKYDKQVSIANIVLMSCRFNVSVEAMFRRLEQLKQIPSGYYDANKTRFEEKLKETVLGGPIEEPLRAPPRLSVLAVEAYSKELLSEGQVADMLALDRYAVRELLDNLSSETADLVDG